MKPSELFGVVVRVTGFLVILYSLWNILGGFDNIIENLLPMNQDNSSDAASTLSYFVFGVPGLLAGALCFFLADGIVKLAYRDGSR